MISPTKTASKNDHGKNSCLVLLDRSFIQSRKANPKETKLTYVIGTHVTVARPLFCLYFALLTRHVYYMWHPQQSRIKNKMGTHSNQRPTTYTNTRESKRDAPGVCLSVRQNSIIRNSRSKSLIRHLVSPSLSKLNQFRTPLVLKSTTHPRIHLTPSLSPRPALLPHALNVRCFFFALVRTQRKGQLKKTKRKVRHRVTPCAKTDTLFFSLPPLKSQRRLTHCRGTRRRNAEGEPLATKHNEEKKQLKIGAEEDAAA